MSRFRVGILWCFTFIFLEAIQSVFFGGVFQRMDSFFIGFLIFATTTSGAILWTAITAPEQLRIAVRNLGSLVGANVSVALAFVAYLLSVQMIEPAVAFAVFSGALPLTVLFAARIGVPEADGVSGKIETLGNLVLLGGVVMLSVVTIGGGSGFVRGGVEVAIAGIGLALAAGVIITWLLFYSHRLDRAGVAPIAQFGLRFVLYVGVTAVGSLLGLDYKGPVAATEIVAVVLIGFVVMSFPLYAFQKAVPLVSPLTIAAIGSLGPLLVFLFQLIEGRVDYAPATLTGLMVYFAGAMLAAYGATTKQPVAVKSQP